MKHFRVSAALILLAVASLSTNLAARDWPQFRGPAGNSVSHDAQPPANWSDTENVAWKADLPGRGPSSPIVVGRRVFVTCSSGVNQDRLHVLCFDAANGKRLWERQFWATGRTLSHPSSANAAPTPASDGESVFAFFSSNDLVCLDLDGNLKWLRGLSYDFPKAGNDVGMSSSPLVIGDIVVAQVECQGDSFVTGVDKKTGEPLWRVERPREASWASPVAVDDGKGESKLVLVQSTTKLSAHDPATGREVWAFDSACDAISSALAADGIVYVPSKGTTAIKPGSAAAPEVVWNESRLQPGAASMLLADGRLFAINTAGVLVIADAADGKILSRVRMEGAYWGTPALVGNRLYAINQDGAGTIVEVHKDGQAEIIGKGKLEGPIQASPAISDGALYVRSDKHLWKIANR